MRKTDFCICENKDADQLKVTAKLISAFVFAKWIVQYLFYLNPKFQVSRDLLWLHSPVCFRPSRKPRRPVFSEQGSIAICIFQRHYSMLEPPSLDCFLQLSGILIFRYHMSHIMRKPVFGVSDQVRHKSGCATTDDG